jgi:hypothetical protein
MLFTTLLLPLLASASVLDTAAPGAANMVVQKLEPRYRKTANRHRYKLGRKFSNIDTEARLISYSIHHESGFDQSGTILLLHYAKKPLQSKWKSMHRFSRPGRTRVY